MALRRGHKLLTKPMEKQMPAYGTFGEEEDYTKIPVRVKFFSPYSGWTWYAAEYDPEHRVFWGVVRGFETERGPFSLDELESTAIMPGLAAVERDLYWDPNTTLEQVLSGEVT